MQIFALSVSTNGGAPVEQPGKFLSAKDAKHAADQLHERERDSGASVAPLRLAWHTTDEGETAAAEYIELLFGDLTRRVYRVAPAALGKESA